MQLSTRARPDENSVTDEINITWNIPKDDGGFPITGYRIEMLDIQTNNWIEITFVEVSGGAEVGRRTRLKMTVLSGVRAAVYSVQHPVRHHVQVQSHRLQ